MELERQAGEMRRKQTLQSIKATSSSEFESRLQIMLQTVNYDVGASLNDLKTMEDKQREENQETVDNMRYNSGLKDQPPRPTTGILLNLNLEGLVTMGFQEKQKRDRIGIIFKQAKEEGWDVGHIKAESTHEKMNGNLPKSKQDEANQNPSLIYENINIKMKLKEDQFMSKTGTESKITKSFSDGTFELKTNDGVDTYKDYNDVYENKIDVEERSFVNYEQMFSSLPVNETES